MKLLSLLYLMASLLCVSSCNEQESVPQKNKVFPVRLEIKLAPHAEKPAEWMPMFTVVEFSNFLSEQLGGNWEVIGTQSLILAYRKSRRASSAGFTLDVINLCQKKGVKSLSNLITIIKGQGRQRSYWRQVSDFKASPIVIWKITQPVPPPSGAINATEWAEFALELQSLDAVWPETEESMVLEFDNSVDGTHEKVAIPLRKTIDVKP